MRVYRFNSTYCFVGLILAVLVSCSTETEDRAVAKVGDKVLYVSNINDILPNNINEQDSATFTDDYINKWIKQELLILKADENLTAEQKDVTQELEAYRNSLIIYKYKNELIKQRMDTVVTSEHIEDYYNSHSVNFNLNKNIVKSVFIKIPNELANPELVKELVNDTSEDGINELREYGSQYAKKISISMENWIDFKMLEKNLPVSIDNAERFLRQKSLREMNDSNYYYLVRVHDYKLINDLAPLEYVENDIKNLILNQRKIKFLQDIEENIYTEGVRQNKFRIYDRETNEDKE